MIHSIAVIGSTGKGNYGHHLDTAVQNLDNTEIGAIADADPEGLCAAGAKLAVSHLHSDYRALLAAEKPAIAVICPRSVAERVPMIEATAAAARRSCCTAPISSV